MISFLLKRGDTFLLAATVNASGDTTPLDLTGRTVRSQARRTGALVQELTVTITDAEAGEFTLGATATETAEWPLGRLACDIERTDADGHVESSETFTIEVTEDVTLPVEA